MRYQRRRARLVEAERTVTQIIMHYNSGMQKGISEHTCQTSRWIGYSSRILNKLKKL